MYWLGWEKAWGPQLVENTIEEKNCLCAVDCALFDQRSGIEDRQIENGQNRRAAIEFRHRLLRDLDVAAVGWKNGFKERQEAWRAIEKSRPLSREKDSANDAMRVDKECYYCTVSLQQLMLIMGKVVAGLSIELVLHAACIRVNRIVHFARRADPCS